MDARAQVVVCKLLLTLMISNMDDLRVPLFFVFCVCTRVQQEYVDGVILFH